MSRLKFSYRSARLSVVFPVLAAMVLLGACGEKKETGTTQVAAKVNSDEITVHQLEFVLRSQQRSLPPEQIEAASRLLLEQMIDQQLQMQKAQSEKLDRDPEVVQRLDAARRDILATRYLEKVTEKVGTPTEDAIKKYYASRPAIFADRKIFTFQRLDIAAPPARRDDIVTRVEAAQSATELSDWLKAQDLRYGASPMTQPAESLPSSVLEKVLSLKEGSLSRYHSRWGSWH